MYDSGDLRSRRNAVPVPVHFAFAAVRGRGRGLVLDKVAVAGHIRQRIPMVEDDQQWHHY